MKHTRLILAAIIVACAFNGCIGDHSGSEHGKDTEKNTYGVARDTSKVDTAKTTTVTGSASSLDNSGAGGTTIAKPDTGKK